MSIMPYLMFEGRCEEAIAFYKDAIGAEVQDLMRIKDAPDPPPPGMMPPGSENKIMHATLMIAGSAVGVSDGMCSGSPHFSGVSLTILASSEDEVDRYFNALAEGGAVQMPLGKTFFAKRFGGVADRFGMSWMFICPA